MPSYKTKSISIKTAPFAEADKLVTLFTRERGKIRVLAKGSRRIPSRLGGRVESFTYADCYIAGCRSLDILSQCQVIESFQWLRQDPKRLPAGLYMLKLISLGTVEGQPNPELFDLLLESLLKLKNEERVRKAAKEFEREFVRREGILREDLDPHYILSEHVGKDLSRW